MVAIAALLVAPPLQAQNEAIVARADTLLHEGTAPPEALTQGFRWGFWVAAGIWTAGLLASLIFIRREEVAQPEAVELAAPQA